MGRNKGIIMILKTCLELCEINGIVCFKNNAIVKMFYDDLPKNNKWVGITLKKPSKIRSTGKGSKNNLFHGWVRDIVSQAKSNYGVTISESQAKEELKEYAMNCFDYPAIQGLWKRIPESTEGQKDEEFNKLLKALEQYADDKDFWLTRIDKIEGEYKSIKGGDRSYMRENYPEINGD